LLRRSLSLSGACRYLFHSLIYITHRIGYQFAPELPRHYVFHDLTLFLVR
jgi:hypothetical protein